jgi:hypothetical protein
MYPKSPWLYFVTLCLAVIPISSVAATPIQVAEVKYDADPLDVGLLKDTSILHRNIKVITADTIEDFPRFRSSMPSLWWIQDQLDRDSKLVSNWLIYPEKKRIDLVVNPQFWNNLEYLERYKLVNRYGLVARRYGYNLRIFNIRFNEVKPIVAYTCAQSTTSSRCDIKWEENRQRSIRVNTAR